MAWGSTKTSRGGKRGLNWGKMREAKPRRLYETVDRPLAEAKKKYAVSFDPWGHLLGEKTGKNRAGT